MRAVRVWLSRLLDIFTGGQRDRAVREEIQQHLDLLTEEHMRRGLSRAEAELAARKSFGGVDQVVATYRDQRGWPRLGRLVQDAGFAWRQLWRDRRFTAAAVIVLGLGVGVSHLFFTLTYAHTLRGLPIPAVDRVLYVSTATQQGPAQGLSYQEFIDLRASQQAFVDLAAFTNTPITLGGEGEVPDRLDAAYTTGSGFSLAGVTAVHGRLFTPDDERKGAAPVLVLTERVWTNRYGRHPDVLGHVVLVGGTPVTIVGVVPDASGMPSAAAVFLPLVQQPGLVDTPRGSRALRVFGRVRDGAPLADAVAEVLAIGTQWESAFPQSNRGIRLVAVPIDQQYGAPLAGWLPFLLAGMVVVAVASANVGNLMLTRGAQRARELAIRTALGASRGRVVRQLLMESALIAAVACGLGFVISRAGLVAQQNRVPENALPYWINYSMDAVTLVAAPAITVATAVVFALIPAFAASRTDVVLVLKDGSRGDTGRRGTGRAATAFLAVELALAIVLLTQVGRNVNPFGRDVPTDRLLDDRRVFTGALTMAPGDANDPTVRRAFFDSVVDRMAKLPGVTAVSLASHLPLGGASSRRLALAARPLGSGETAPSVLSVQVSPAYFDALDLPLKGGRAFRVDEASATHGPVIVNERLAQLHFPGADPIGQRIALMPESAAAAQPEWRTIVGVVPDVRQRDLPQAQPVAYLPLAASPPASVWLLVRSPASATSLAGPVREALRQLDPGVPLSNPRTLAMATRDLTWVGRVSASFASIVCIATFVLATVGLYAVVAHRAAQRRRECGLRMVLGARTGALVRLVTGQVRTALLLGLVLGLLGAAAWDRAFSPASQSAVRMVDPLVLAVAVGVLALAVGLGCALPIRRAVSVSPADVLRDE